MNGKTPLLDTVPRVIFLWALAQSSIKCACPDPQVLPPFEITDGLYHIVSTEDASLSDGYVIISGDALVISYDAEGTAVAAEYRIQFEDSK
jgi:hypothetical protein